MKHTKKLILVIGLLIGCLYLVKYTFEWHNSADGQGFDDAQHCIFDDKNHKQITLNSMGHVFNITYVKNSSYKCAGSDFPAIEITTEALHDRWIMVTHNQGDKLNFEKIQAYPNPKLFHDYEQAIETGNKDLIDKTNKEAIEVHWKFYSSDKNFFINRFTSYGFYFNKNFYVQHHIYAVQSNLEQKTVHCVGGISYGYKLRWWNFRPAMIYPQSLTQDNWKNDWAEISKRQFKEYKDITK